MLRAIGLSIVICVPALYAGNLNAQDLSIAPRETGAAQSVPFDPNDLRPEWWRYFDVGADELGPRITEVLSNLETIVSAAPRSQQDQLRDTLERLTINLQALPKLKTQEGPSRLPLRELQKTYSIDQVLKLNRSVREAEKQLSDLRMEVDGKVEATKAAQRRVDTDMAAYLELPPMSAERLPNSLRIIAGRAAVAVAQEQIRLLNANVEIQEEHAKQLNEEKRAALEHVATSTEERTLFEKDIGTAEQDLEKARDELRAEQYRAVGLVGDTPRDKAQERYRSQAALRAAAKEGLARTFLAITRAKHDWAAVNSEEVQVDVDEARQRLKEWRLIVEEKSAALQQWRAASERELRSLRSANEEAAYPASEDHYKQRLALVEETFAVTQRLEDRLADLELLSTRISGLIADDRGFLHSWFASGEGAVGNIWEKIWGWFKASLFKVGDTPVTPLGLLRVIVILTIAFWLSRLIRHALDRIAARQPGVDRSAFYTVGRLVHYLILIVALLIGLSSIGLDFTNLAFVAGALGVGIGFGLQSIVSNFVSGLILLFERSLKVGDYVELDSGVTGVVREINVRSTLINTNDNIDILVPNSEFVSGKLINWTLRETNRRLHVPFGVAYGTDKDLVRKAALEAAQEVSFTLQERRPEVWLVEFGDSSLDFELVVWVSPDAVVKPGAIQAAYLWEIETSLKKHGIEIPFPQRDLHLRSGFQKLES